MSGAGDPGVGALDLRGLAPGTAVVGRARVVASERAIARTGAAFHRLTLGDARGVSAEARRFDVGEAPAPPAGCVVRIAGVVELYRGRLGLKLSGCVEDPALPVAAFLPRMPADRAATLADLDALIAAIGDPALRAWVTACFRERRDAFAAHPAAQTLHHAAVGGLLAHTVRVARLARVLAGLLPDADPDLVTAGALLHDLGKLAELSPVPGEAPTDGGRLLGHLVLGVRLATAAAAGIPGLEPAIAERVLHAILASHGKPEWGSPVAIATGEALVVHLADLAEVKLEQAAELLERTPPGAAWTAYAPALGTRLRTGRGGGEA